MFIAVFSIQSANDDNVVEFSLISDVKTKIFQTSSKDDASALSSSNIQKKIYKSVFIIINFDMKNVLSSPNAISDSEDDKVVQSLRLDHENDEKEFDENEFAKSSRQIRLKNLIRQKKSHMTRNKKECEEQNKNKNRVVV